MIRLILLFLIFIELVSCESHYVNSTRPDNSHNNDTLMDVPVMHP